MSYKFVKVSSFNNSFLNDYYSKNIDIQNDTYERQFNHLMSKGFAWSDFFKIHLSNLGVIADEIVVNAKPLQNAWARENNTRETGSKLLVSQLKSLQPEVLMFQDCAYVDPSLLNEIRSDIKSIKRIIGWYCSPISDAQLKVFKCFDAILCCSEPFMDILNKAGLKTFRFLHGFEHTLLKRIDENNEYSMHDIVFIGSLIQGEDYHNFRINLLKNILKNNEDFYFYSNYHTEKYLRFKAQQYSFVFNRLLSRMGLNKISELVPVLKKANAMREIPSRQILPEEFTDRIIHANLFGLEMLKALSRSKIGINIHGGIACDYAANIRLYEITGVGSCMVTDHKKNIKDLFDPDNEIVTYKTIDECQSKIKWLLDNPHDRERIAKNGQKRTLKDHTIKKRIELLHEYILTELLKG